jgi:hypothetical protein
MKTLILGFALALAAAGCSKHDCELASESDKKNFGEVAEMTGGAANCFLSNGELIATHGDTSVDKITDKYKAFLEGKGWKTEVKDHTGKRSNGNEYKGKLLAAEKGDLKIGTLIYPLGDTLIETVTITRD